jgi:hypothetical protein
MTGMSSTDTTTPPPETEDTPKGWDALDTAGLIAGVILAVILADILSDGRLVSRRLRPRPAQPATDEVPVE